MFSGGNQTNGNTLERFLTPYQYSRLPLRLAVSKMLLYQKSQKWLTVHYTQNAVCSEHSIEIHSLSSWSYKHKE